MSADGLTPALRLRHALSVRRDTHLSAPAAGAAPRGTAAPPTTKAADELLRRQLRLRWIGGEVARIQDEVRSHRVALDALVAASLRGPLPDEERTRRRDLVTKIPSLRLRLAELRAELEAMRSGETL